MNNIANQQTNTSNNKMTTQVINGYDSNGNFVIENNQYIVEISI